MEAQGLFREPGSACTTEKSSRLASIPDQGARPQPVGHAPLEHHGQGAAAPIVLRSPVAGDSTVLSILPLDTQVKKGQPVCELDASDLNDELAAQPRLAAAQADYDLATRKNVLEIAELSLKEYQEGRYAVEQLSLQGEIKITKAETVLAEKELAQARKDAGEDSQAARRSDLALERHLRFGLEQAHARLRHAREVDSPKASSDPQDGRSPSPKRGGARDPAAGARAG